MRRKKKRLGRREREKGKRALNWKEEEFLREGERERGRERERSRSYLQKV